ncbi:MAG TPA: ASKHA domain-containing protein, partial [Thermoleophilia bacterium]|nr:ASKHA domain-containing protein [Thermoleophilia bacterium]
GGKMTTVPRGTSLLDAAVAAGLEIAAPCGGQGRCGRCKVTVRGEGLERRDNARLTADEVAAGVALACQAFVAGPVDVYLPEVRDEEVRPHGHAVAEPESLPVTCDWRQNPAVRTFDLDIEPPSLADNTSDFDRLRRALARQYGIKELRAELAILRGLSRDLRMANWKVNVALEMRDWVYGTYLPPRLIRVYPRAFGQRSMGLAIDVGTTSVVAYLVDFTTAQVVDSGSAYNKQIACGEDVISRIIYAKRKGGLERLQRLAVESVNEIVAGLHDRNGIEPAEIHEVTVAGNTTMTHLLLGLDPRHLREEPYIPTMSITPKLVASEIGLDVNPQARVHLLPSVGSYVGGDITAGVISSGMFASDRLTLFIDIGTNGEIVLGGKDWLIACACSAGPAFEGGGVAHGMRASSGAIEDVWVNAETYEPTFRTIDDAPAVGICGSGLIDLLGELFTTGVVDKSGHIDRTLATVTPRVRSNGNGVPQYVVAFAHEAGADHDIVLTESDVNSLIRAKAAIYAGYSVLCRGVGVDLADVEQILIGGAFGQYLDVEKAIRIGLLPDLPVEKFHFLGNTSVMGAYTALLCVNMRHDVLDVAAKMTYLELSADNSFMDDYTSALFLPHTDLDTFPTVRDLLAARGEGGRGPREE